LTWVTSGNPQASPNATSGKATISQNQFKNWSDLMAQLDYPDVLKGWLQHSGPAVREIARILDIDVDTNEGIKEFTEELVEQAGYEPKTQKFRTGSEGYFDPVGPARSLTNPDDWVKLLFGPGASDLILWTLSRSPGPSNLDPRNLWNVGTGVKEELVEGKPFTYVDMMTPEHMQDIMNTKDIDYWMAEDPVGQHVSDVAELVTSALVGYGLSKLGGDVTSKIIQAGGAQWLWTKVKQWGPAVVTAWLTSHFIGNQVERGTGGLEESFDAYLRSQEGQTSPEVPTPQPESIVVEPTKETLTEPPAVKPVGDVPTLQDYDPAPALNEIVEYDTKTYELPDFGEAQKVFDYNALMRNLLLGLVTGAGRTVGSNLMNKSESSSGGGGGPQSLLTLAQQEEEWKKKKKFGPSRHVNSAKRVNIDRKPQRSLSEPGAPTQG
jgi:hypothetical protein